MTDWTEPKHPGDAVRITLLQRGNEIGDVRIQHYGPEHFHVASFLPGHDILNPGDTWKTEPDASEWHMEKGEANRAFDEAVRTALADGWSVSERNR